MEPNDLGWNPLLQSWMNTLPAVISPWLRNFIYESLFRRFCDPIFDWLHQGLTQVRIFKVFHFFFFNLFHMQVLVRLIEYNFSTL